MGTLFPPYLVRMKSIMTTINLGIAENYKYFNSSAGYHCVETKNIYVKTVLYLHHNKNSNISTKNLKNFSETLNHQPTSYLCIPWHTSRPPNILNSEFIPFMSLFQYYYPYLLLYQWSVHIYPWMVSVLQLFPVSALLMLYCGFLCFCYQPLGDVSRLASLLRLFPPYGLTYTPTMLTLSLV